MGLSFLAVIVSFCAFPPARRCPPLPAPSEISPLLLGSVHPSCCCFAGREQEAPLDVAGQDASGGSEDEAMAVKLLLSKRSASSQSQQHSAKTSAAGAAAAAAKVAMAFQQQQQG